MKTAAECVPAHYVKTERGHRPEPRYRQSWSYLRKLQWKASLIMSENPGVRLYIMKGRGFTNGIFQYGQFQVSYNNGGMSAMPFDAVWDLLNGIDLGLRLAERRDTP